MQNSDKLTLELLPKKGKYNRIFLFLFFVFFSFPVHLHAQKNEIGVAAGAFNYTGDLSKNINLLNFRPAGQVFHNRNFNKGVASRIAITGGRIAGSDQLNRNDVLAQQRNYSFSNGMFEVSAALVYHFLDYKGNKTLVNFSPYFTLGGGIFVLFRNDKLADYSTIQFAIPMGVGVKWNISPYIDLGFEFSAKRTFFDYLDNISREEISTQSGSDYLFGSWNENDWYYFTGFSISYLFYDINCPNPWHRRLVKK
jgi:hypothetical protein